MNAYDHDLHHQLRKLEIVEARLAQHERITRIALSVVTMLASLALALIVNYIPGCVSVAKRLLGLIP